MKLEIKKGLLLEHSSYEKQQLKIKEFIEKNI
jgi:hypothetical protein